MGNELDTGKTGHGSSVSSLSEYECIIGQSSQIGQMHSSHGRNIGSARESALQPDLNIDQSIHG